MFQPGPTLFSFRGLIGERVDVSSSLFVLLGLFLMLAGVQNFLWVFTILAMLLLSIYLHELGHAWASEVTGLGVRRVVLHGGGGFCERVRTGRPKQMEFVVLMGPLVNLTLWAVGSLGAWWIWSGSETSWGVVGSYLMLFARLNFALLVFNLLPVQPLDGGKLLHLFALRFLPRSAAMRLAGMVGLVFSALWWPALIYVYITYGWLLLFAPPIMLHWKMAKGEVVF